MMISRSDFDARPALARVLVAAADAGRRMQYDGVAEFRSFGVERLLDAQRTGILAAGEDRVRTAPLEAEAQPSLPGSLGQQGIGKTGGHATIFDAGHANAEYVELRRPVACYRYASRRLPTRYFQ